MRLLTSQSQQARPQQPLCNNQKLTELIQFPPFCKHTCLCSTILTEIRFFIKESHNGSDHQHHGSHHHEVRNKIALSKYPYLTLCLLCSNRNMIACLHNSQLSRPDQPLKPLFSGQNHRQRLPGHYIFNIM